MAFKVLTKEQVELLTEEEKTRYAKQLELYRQREAFVEQMEAYESIQFPEVQATLQPISVVNLGEVPEIHVPEIEVEVPQISANFQMPELPNIVTPTVTVNDIPVVTAKIGEIPSIHIENPQSSVPKVSVPTVPIIDYKAPLLESISVPDPIQVAIPEIKPFKMEAPEVQVMAPEPVQIEVPTIGTLVPQEIVSPQLDNVMLPEIDGEIIRSMLNGVQVQESPAVPIPTVNVPKLGAFQVEASSIPQVSIPTPDIPDIQMPENAAVQVPVLQPLPELTEFPEIQMPEAVAVQTPAELIPKLPELSEFQIKMPAIQSVQAMKITVPEIPTLSFERPVIHETPQITVPTMSESLANIAASLQVAQRAASAPVKTPKIQVNRVELDEAELAEIRKLIQRKE